MKLRKTAPGPENKYYLKAPAGYNPCILGNSTNRQYPDSVLANCVGGAVGLFNEMRGAGNCNLLGNRNPDSMAALASSQGLEIGSQPRPGAACVQYGSRQHIFIIGKLIKTRTGYTAEIYESGWSFPAGTYWKCRISTNANNWGMGSAYTTRLYIYQPDINPYWQVPAAAIKYGSRGEGAKYVQWALVKEQCFEKNSPAEIDGIFGLKSAAALKIFQDKNGLEPDGIAGPLTKAVINEKYLIE